MAPSYYVTWGLPGPMDVLSAPQLTASCAFAYK
jgi:hypothetical protein